MQEAKAIYYSLSVTSEQEPADAEEQGPGEAEEGGKAHCCSWIRGGTRPGSSQPTDQATFELLLKISGLQI